MEINSRLNGFLLTSERKLSVYNSLGVVTDVYLPIGKYSAFALESIMSHLIEKALGTPVSVELESNGCGEWSMEMRTDFDLDFGIRVSDSDGDLVKMLGLNSERNDRLTSEHRSEGSIYIGDPFSYRLDFDQNDRLFVERYPESCIMARNISDSLFTCISEHDGEDGEDGEDEIKGSKYESVVHPFSVGDRIELIEVGTVGDSKWSATIQNVPSPFEFELDETNTTGKILVRRIGGECRSEIVEMTDVENRWGYPIGVSGPNGEFGARGTKSMNFSPPPFLYMKIEPNGSSATECTGPIDARSAVRYFSRFSISSGVHPNTIHSHEEGSVVFPGCVLSHVVFKFYEPDGSPVDLRTDNWFVGLNFSN